VRNQSAQNQDDQLAQIDDYNSQIDAIYDTIALLKDEKFEAEREVRVLEKEVGPIKYVAQLLFGGDDQELLDKAVQVFILMLVFVFDPLAVMLVIAANQTLLRYGINLEKAGPDDDRDQSNSGIAGNANSPNGGAVAGQTDDKNNNKNSSQGGNTADNSVHLQQVGATGLDGATQQVDQPSSVDDAATAMMESAAKKSKPKRKPRKKKEPEIDLSVPPAIEQLEKRIQEKLNG
jgi:hypothetical protein